MWDRAELLVYHDAHKIGVMVHSESIRGSKINIIATVFHSLASFQATVKAARIDVASSLFLSHSFTFMWKGSVTVVLYPVLNPEYLDAGFLTLNTISNPNAVVTS